MERNPKYDWFKFWVWFACGMAGGAVLGLRIWIRSDAAMAHSMRPRMCIMSGTSLFCGLVAGLLSNSGCDED
jgi:hypothetical protein